MDLEPWSEGLLGRVLHGRYELLAPLAAGGMGVVFEARHRTLETRLAVKVLTPELRGSSRARARFVREARLAASVGGTGVVRVFDLGELEDAGPYLVMELLEGEPLAAWMERQGRVSPAAIGELVLPLLETLARLHRADLVHRDIKPSNVFLAREGEQTVVKLLDFGIARLDRPDTESVTLSGSILGTPRYMSPEQARAEDATRASDLYAVGAIVYEALSGKPPYHDVPPERVLRSLLAGPPAPVAWLQEDLLISAGEWVGRAMAYDPSSRFEDAETMAAALREVLSHPEAARVPIANREAETMDEVPPASDEAETVGSPAPASRPRLVRLALGAVGAAALSALAFALWTEPAPEADAPAVQAAPRPAVDPAPVAPAAPHATPEPSAPEEVPEPAAPVATPAPLRRAAPRVPVSPSEPTPVAEPPRADDRHPDAPVLPEGVAPMRADEFKG